MMFTIICVDDEKMITDSLKTQLKNYLGNEYAIETAESGEEALALLDELEAEGAEVLVVISDYLMPGLKGDEFLSLLNTRNDKMIKILLTGQATIEGVANAINQANLYRFISKPWIKEDIELSVAEAIKSYLKDREIERQHQELQLWSTAFIETMSTTLDQRDATTSGHSRRLAAYTLLLAQAINATTEGTYRDYQLTDQEIEELYYAALLHDIGKIGISENVLLKEARLSKEKVETIHYRFAWIKALFHHRDQEGLLSISDQLLLEKIDEFYQFILDINQQDYLTDEQSQMVIAISNWHFIDEDNLQQNLLTEEERTHLLVRKGNLTSDERKIIEEHAKFTYEILKSIPWPHHLARVPMIAASHHEKLDGSGYFQGLKHEEISVQARILAILDIYEALTSYDRPYKPAKSHEEAIAILAYDVEQGKLDRDLFTIFKNIPKDQLLKRE